MKYLPLILLPLIASGQYSPQIHTAPSRSKSTPSNISLENVSTPGAPTIDPATRRIEQQLEERFSAQTAGSGDRAAQLEMIYDHAVLDFLLDGQKGFTLKPLHLQGQPYVSYPKFSYDDFIAALKSGKKVTVVVDEFRYKKGTHENVWTEVKYDVAWN